MEVSALQSGYVATVDHISLVATAKRLNGKCLMLVSAGDFVVKGQTILRICKQGSEDAECSEKDGKAFAELENKINNAVELELSRSDHGSINFSVKLLIEVAIRALSPGVNDTFTALTVCDHLSDAFSKLWTRQSRYVSYRDDENELRLIIVQNSTKDLMDQAFHPLRLAARYNVLMAQGLARAYARLLANDGQDMCDLLKPHVHLLICQMQQDNSFDEDIARVTDLLPKALLPE